MHPNPEYFDLEATFTACDAIATRVKQAGRLPDIVIGLATGGNFCAQRIAELLGVRTVIVLPVRKADGVRSIDPTATLVSTHIAGKFILGVDDAIATGKLLRDLGEQVQRRGGQYIPAALVGVGAFADLPGLMVAHRLPAVPTFFGESGLPN